ncbi:MAG: carbohydrate ABC transporter permease [Hungatella sp.]
MNTKTKRNINSVILQTLSIAFGLVLVSPVIYCVLLSFMQPSEILSIPPTLFPSKLYLENYAMALKLTKIPRFIVNSLLVSVGCSLMRILTASLAAYAFAFFEFRGKNFLFYLVLGTMLIPGDATIVTNYMTVSGMGLVNNYLGIMILYFVSAANIFLMRQYFLTLSKELKEAAEIDGCGSFKFYTTILIPIAKPIIATVFISSFVSTWNMYLWPMLITTRNEMRTVQVGITMLNFSEEAAYGSTMAGAVLVLIPSLFVFVLSQKQIVKGMTAGSIKG